MREALTISQALNWLHERGYIEDFRAERGELCINPAKLRAKPEELIVDKIFRFEGETDLEDEAILFALCHAPSGIKGTYLVAYGPAMDPKDASIVQRLGNAPGPK